MKKHASLRCICFTVSVWVHRCPRLLPEMKDTIAKNKSPPSPAKSGCIAQLGFPVSAALCGCVHSVALLSSCRSAASSWLWHWERRCFPFDLLADLAPVFAFLLCLYSNTALACLAQLRENVFARTERVIWTTCRSRSRSRVQRQPFERQAFVSAWGKELKPDDEKVSKLLNECMRMRLYSAGTRAGQYLSCTGMCYWLRRGQCQ